MMMNRWLNAGNLDHIPHVSSFKKGFGVHHRIQNSIGKIAKNWNFKRDVFNSSICCVRYVPPVEYGACQFQEMRSVLNRANSNDLIELD